MARLLHRGFVIPALLGVLLLGAPSPAQEYTIKLDRPDKVGETYTISATGKATQGVVFDIPGKPPQKQENSFTIQLQGTIKVSTVDEQSGESSRIDCIVSKCLKDGQPLVEPGTVLTAENKTGKTEYSANGAPVAPTTAQALELVLYAHQPGRPPTNDSVFGNHEPQKLGAVWPINREAAAREASQSGLPVAKESISGEAKLVAMKKVDGVQALQVEATMNVKRISGTMPDGSEIESGTITAHYGGFFPIDEARREISEAQSMDLQMVRKVRTPDNQVVTARITGHRTSQIHYGQTGK